MSRHSVAVHWFRKGLRLHDNPALLAATKKADCVFPVFVIDPHFANPEKVGILRYRFLLESLTDLDKSLRRINSRLYVARGKPEAVVPGLMKKWGASLLTYERDTEPYAKVRDAKIAEAAADFVVESFTSHTLHDPAQLLQLAKGKVTTAYGAFRKVFHRAGPVPQPVETVTSCGQIPAKFCVTAGVGPLHVPTLEEMGYTESTVPSTPFRGGETVGLTRMRKQLARKAWICAFQKPKTSPNSLEPSTTVLSPYLKFGCVSPRTFWHALHDVYASAKNKRTQPPVSLDGQLLWREFFYFVGSNTSNYGRMEGNPICRQIPWKRNEAHLAAWEAGQTGYPWIDAAMSQLRQQGWIHHLARHAVACFLTRGDLWISWEEGARVFDKHLLDADWSINNGNWMWLSASCFFYQYFRIYSPVSFGKKTDKSGEYVKKWVPALSKFPSKYIYEPWKAPRSVQKAAGCIIGKDYPLPIVDHAECRKENMTRMKAAYAAHKLKNAAPSKSKSKSTKTSRKRAPAKTVPAKRQKRMDDFVVKK